MEEASIAKTEEEQQQQSSSPESLLLSFENPNYQFEKKLQSMDQARIDDHLNSNIEPNMYEELCNELKIYTELSGKIESFNCVENVNVTKHDFAGEGIENKSNRWTYAQLNSTAMGVLSSPQTEKEVSCEKDREEEENQRKEQKVVKHGDLTEGWEMHEDEGGLYFWHVKSGTIQREIPPAFQNSSAKLTKSSTSSNICKLQSQQPQSSSTNSASSDNVEQKRKSLPPQMTSDDPNAGMQVKVKSLGSIQLSEDSLTNENSSRAVNRCIVQLSTGTADLTDDERSDDSHKELILSLNEGTLKLIDPESGAVVNAQPIHTIRVWGVGRDDSRDFAYVARDKATRCHTCHVFRCDVPARAVANKLRDICKKILIERSLTQSSAKLMDKDQLSRKDSTSSRSSLAAAEDCSTASTLGPASSVAASAPTGSNLIRPTHFTTKLKTKTVSRAPDSFPTPMEEPKKIIKARFIGEVEVSTSIFFFKSESHRSHFR